MSFFGNSVLLFSLFVAAYGTWAAFVGGWRKNQAMVASAARSMMVLVALSSLLIGLLAYAFLTHDFSLEYVATYSSRALPVPYQISAIWAGQSGSLLLWAWLLCVFGAIVIWQNRHRNTDLMPVVLGVILVTILFFIGLLVFETSPFEVLPFAVSDGNGMNPLLQNSGMVVHPPLLYLGYVGFTVPFAFAISALATKHVDDRWIRITRRWALVAWIFLTLGILFGMEWAYEELGWGGYWAWDPVENASLMPWLTGTAFLHSVMIQERRGMLKKWNVVLIILTFALTIFGTFITRSGIISSVHAFGRSNLGPLFIGFLVVILAGGFGLAFARRRLLRTENRLDSMVSRESSFLLNNLLLVGMTFAVLWGTIFPVLSQAVRGHKLTVGPPFFNAVNVPIALALLALVGACPLIAWVKTSNEGLRHNFILPVSAGVVTGVVLALLGVTEVLPNLTFALCAYVVTTIAWEFVNGGRARSLASGKPFFPALWELILRNKRRYGGYVVHLGMVMVFVGIAGSSAFEQQSTATLTPGQSATVGSYDIRYDGLVDRSTSRAQVTAARLQVSRHGVPVVTMFPAQGKYPNHDAISEVSIHHSLFEDVYLVLGGWGQGGVASFKFLVIPLVGWIWVGGIVMILGTFLALGPDRLHDEREAVTRSESKPPLEAAHV